MVTGAHFSYMIKRVYEDRVLIPIHPSYPQSTLLVFTEEVWRPRKKATNIKILLFVQYLGISLRAIYIIVTTTPRSTIIKLTNCNDSQRMVVRPTALATTGNLLEMQIWGPTLDLVNQKLW